MKHVIFHHEGNYFSFFEFLHQISSSIVFVIIFLEFATIIDTLLDSCSMENGNLRSNSLRSNERKLFSS